MVNRWRNVCYDNRRMMTTHYSLKSVENLFTAYFSWRGVGLHHVTWRRSVNSNELFSAWCILMCCRNSRRRPKVAPQSRQACGRKPGCRRLCVMRFEDWLKRRPHRWQTYGFSPAIIVHNKHRNKTRNETVAWQVAGGRPHLSDGVWCGEHWHQRWTIK